MEIQILNTTHFTTSQWAGGTTTQLYLYPMDANYQARNFDFRISTARVEAETSTFTSLPQVARKLMILEGAIEIQHEHQYSKQLKVWDIDSFLGDWNTTAKGTCTDFNVMTTNTTLSNLESLHLANQQEFNLRLDGAYTWFFIYVFKGTLTITIAQHHYELAQGNLFVIHYTEVAVLTMFALANCELVLVQIG